MDTLVNFKQIAERVCLLCVRDGLFIIEDEFHFVFCCPSYSDIREQYISFIPEKDFVSFVNIMSSTDPNVIKPLASYVYHSFKHRAAILSDT